MKTNSVFRFWVAGAAVVLPLLNGCTKQSASNTPVYHTTTSAPAPVIVHPTIVNTTPPPPAPAPASAPTPVAEPLIVINSNSPSAGTNGLVVAEPVTPQNLRVSQALGDVIHLAQSGVEETIILTYVTNSPAAFLLGAEEIVYLKDLGVSSGVITSMMQRDQVLKQQWGIAGQPAAVAPATTVTQETVAAVPTYVNPPQPVTVVESQPVYVSDNYFYDSLNPYGTWVEIDGYGRCWRPTIAIRSSSWRPYCDGGRWIYTDSGWFWMSDYSWGSVAFHYGRWFSHPRWGWCWWPDRVWAPSWVSWRYDNDHCGWAPLPPNSIYTPGVGFSYFGRSVGVNFDFHLGVGAYTFVPWGRFCDPYPYRHCLPQPRSVAIYTGTTIVNHYDRGHNNRVENRGIPTDRVRERTRAEVRPVKIREENVRNASLRADRIEGSGRTLVVHRPEPLAPKGGSPMVAPVERATPRGSETPRKIERNEPRRTERSAPIIVNNAAPTAPAPAVAPAPPTRTGTAELPERKLRPPETTEPRSRENKATVVRLPEQKAPTPVTQPTPIFSKPVVVETRPRISAPTETAPSTPAPIVIGNGRNSSGGRDYSVWNNPPQRPASSPTAVAPTPNTSSGRSRAVVESAPQSPVNSASPDSSEINRIRENAINRARENSRQQEILMERSQRMERNERSVRSRAEERSSSPSFSTPSAPTPRVSAPAVVIPAPAPAPRPVYTPAPTPTPVAPRVQSQPAPVRSEPSRSESRPDADAGRGPRNR